MNDILNQIKYKIGKDKVIVACSTGVDSMVLFDLCQKVLDKDQIIVAHVNHHKRNQANEEEAYLQSYCQENNIKFCALSLKEYNGSNFQMWAREQRYEFFITCAQNYNAKYILLAHHADDNIETILMRLIRSSSLIGYAGIINEIKINDLIIYRPLLNITKDQIKNYALDYNLKYYEDSSNSELEYMRNRIRKYILPALISENPNIYDSFKYFSDTIYGANEILEKTKKNFIENKVNVHTNNNSFLIKFLIKDFFDNNSFLQKEILFTLLKPYALSTNCINDLIKQISSKKGNIVNKIKNDLLMIKEYETISFTNVNKTNDFFEIVVDKECKITLPNNNEIYVDKNYCNLITPNGKICYNIQELPIIIRTRKNGDYIKKEYGHKSVSDYLTDHKVPYLERKDILLLCNKENEVIYILGLKP